MRELIWQRKVLPNAKIMLQAIVFASLFIYLYKVALKNYICISKFIMKNVRIQAAPNYRLTKPDLLPASVGKLGKKKLSDCLFQKYQ